MKQDTLRKLRNQFLFLLQNDEPFIYLCGNSLGLQPKSARHHIDEQLGIWHNSMRLTVRFAFVVLILKMPLLKWLQKAKEFTLGTEDILATIVAQREEIACQMGVKP